MPSEQVETIVARGIVPRLADLGKPLTPDSAREAVRAAFADEMSDSDPTIHVSIGRIEVKTAAPPTPPQRTARKRMAPRLTLDEYLRRRREGRR